MKTRFALLPLVLILLAGCGKEDKNPQSPPGSLNLEFEHQVDGDSLQFNKMIYTNASGNEFRVSRLKYFISGVTVFAQGEEKYQQLKPVPVNALYADECRVPVQEIPAGTYDSVSFSLGVVPEFNYPNAFQLDNNNLDMYWPTSMGGGYHFMKFEGHWQDGDRFGGYAFHLGMNENLLTTGFATNLEIVPGETSPLIVVMNLNQWFEDPHLYDLLLEGGYTMGDSEQMQMLVENGHNVFQLKQK